MVTTKINKHTGVWSSGMILALGKFNYASMREALGSIPSSPHLLFYFFASALEAILNL